MIKEKNIVKKFQYFVFNLVSDVVYVIGKKHTWIQKHKYSTKKMMIPILWKTFLILVTRKNHYQQIKMFEIEKIFYDFLPISVCGLNWVR